MPLIVRYRFFLFFSCIALSGIPAAYAQDFPNKPIRIVAPTGPGSLTDNLTRLLLPEVTRALGQPVVVENMPGAAGIVGIRYVTKQVAPDGYTLVILQTTQTIASVFVKAPGFDLQRDLAPVTLLVNSPILLITHFNNPWNTLVEMAAHAKANPGKLNHAVLGPTDLFALYMGAVKSKYSMNIVDVPYKTSPASRLAIVADEVQLLFTSPGNADPMFKAKKAKPLAVSGDARLPSLPDAPTFAELGIPEIDGLKFMIFAPAGTPKPVRDKLRAAFVTALQHQDMKARLESLDLQVVGSTPDALTAQFGQFLERYKTIARNLGIQPE